MTQYPHRLPGLGTTRNMRNRFHSDFATGDAQQFMWGISPEPLMDSAEVISQQIPKGVNYRIISPQPPAKLSNIEIRNHSDVPVILVVTEKEASLSFRFIEGRVDYTSFSGNDPMFLDWIKDLFLYYWEKAERK